MTEDPKHDKKEIDANEVIRHYEETATHEEPEESQTEIPWYEQAKQDTSVPPESVLTGGDIDAVGDPTSAGEETVGGSNPTPDQDIVDEIGRAVGVNYEDGEPLDLDGKIERRDQKRWELHPASSEDFAERVSPVDADMESAPSEQAPSLPKSQAGRNTSKAA
jgi:hypothetical protein